MNRAANSATNFLLLKVPNYFRPLIVCSTAPVRTHRRGFLIRGLHHLGRDLRSQRADGAEGGTIGAADWVSVSRTRAVYPPPQKAGARPHRKDCPPQPVPAWTRPGRTVRLTNLHAIAEHARSPGITFKGLLKVSVLRIPQRCEDGF